MTYPARDGDAGKKLPDTGIRYYDVDHKRAWLLRLLVSQLWLAGVYSLTAPAVCCRDPWAAYSDMVLSRSMAWLWAWRKSRSAIYR